MKTDKWIVDKSVGIVKHINGLMVSIEDGEVSNIEFIPASVTTKELPKLIDEALRAYKNNNMDTPAATQIYTPRKPVLGLKKKA
jgi:hypothetical protein